MLTEKGTEAFEFILIHYKTGEGFKSKDIGFAPATLIALVKEGYLNKKDTKPVTYFLVEGAKEEYEKKKPKKDFLPYSFEEYKEEQKMSYDELCNYLIKKYGVVAGDYFLKENCISQNKKIKRNKEGLYIHHYYEKDHIMLCNSEWASQHTFDYQKGKNLIYCNIFEHLLLHIKITLGYIRKSFGAPDDDGEFPGIGGVVNYIGPAIYAKFYKGEPLVENISEKEFNSIMKSFFDKIEYESEGGAFTRYAAEAAYNKGCEKISSYYM